MDWLKIALERFFALVATVIPGSVILLLFILHNQSALRILWETPALGYETKVALIALCTLTAGFTIQSALSRLGGAIGGGIRGYFATSENPNQQDEVQPWRDPVWRALLKGYLGKSAPDDASYIHADLLEKQLELISVTHRDEKERAVKAVEALREKTTGDFIDHQWATWWHQFHLPALLGLHNPHVVIASQLRGNFQSASLLILLAMVWTPDLRTWWIAIFCLYWLIDLALEIYYLVQSVRDPWSSFAKQVEYLQSKINSNSANVGFD